MNPVYQCIVELIDIEVDYIDIKPYSKRDIELSLRKAKNIFGVKIVNDLIEEFELEKHGFLKYINDDINI